MEQWLMQAAATLVFPAAVTAWLLVRLESRLEKLEARLLEILLVLRK